MSMLVTILGRIHYDGGIEDPPSDRDWVRSNTCEETGPVRFLMGFQYD